MTIIHAYLVPADKRGGQHVVMHVTLIFSDWELYKLFQ